MRSESKTKRLRGNAQIAELGRATRFQRGRSGNPGGRPSKTPFADAHREVAQMPVSELRVKPTDRVALAVAKRVAREAIRGKISAASEAANRAEGSPRQTLPLHEAGDIVVHVVYDKPSNQ